MPLMPPRLRMLFSSLFARIGLTLVIGLLAAQGISFWLQSGERASLIMQARGQNFGDRMAEAIRLLEAADPAHRLSTLNALQGGEMRVMLINDDQVASGMPRGQIQTMLAGRLGSPREIRSPNGMAGVPQRDSPIRVFDVRLRDGQWARITVTVNAETPALPSSLITHLSVMLVAVLAVVLIVVRQISQPLQQLADAADALGRDLDAPPLPEQGSAEMRSAAQSFNRMQARIRRLIDERARALAAVSHDLRTPLTRLRLRAELVDDAAVREPLCADLEAMAAMLDSTLDYLRNLHESEAICRIDINALLRSMAEDFEVLGKTIGITGEALSPYPGRVLALRRAVQNLVDNATKYAVHVGIRVEDTARELRITVEDDGPGIPDAELARITEPYYRPDAARSTDAGGVGLGLSIVRDVALMHGGELLLARTTTGRGLAATLVLPRDSSTP